MKNLVSLGSLSIDGNASLRTIEGFGQIENLAYLGIDRPPMLEVVDLGTLESVETLVIGHCEGNRSAA